MKIIDHPVVKKRNERNVNPYIFLVGYLGLDSEDKNACRVYVNRDLDRYYSFSKDSIQEIKREENRPDYVYLDKKVLLSFIEKNENNTTSVFSGDIMNEFIEEANDSLTFGDGEFIFSTTTASSKPCEIISVMSGQTASSGPCSIMNVMSGQTASSGPCSIMNVMSGQTASSGPCSIMNVMSGQTASSGPCSIMAAMSGQTASSGPCSIMAAMSGQTGSSGPCSAMVILSHPTTASSAPCEKILNKK